VARILLVARFHNFDEGGNMLFIAGMFLGTFIGFLIAGLCFAVRENIRVPTSPGSMREKLETIQLQTSLFS
jgi:hypothetical protein